MAHSAPTSTSTNCCAWTALVSGVISQQLSNAPDESFGDGRFTALLPQLMEMYVTHYAG